MSSSSTSTTSAEKSETTSRAHWFSYLEQVVWWGTLLTVSWNWRHTFHFAQLNGRYFEYGSWHIYASEVGVVLLLLLRLGKRWRVEWRLWMPALALVGWSFATALWSPDTAVSLIRSGHLLLAVVLGMYITSRDTEEVVKPLIIGWLIQAGVAIAQVWHNASLGLQAVGESPLNPMQSGISVVMHNGVRQLRGYGLTVHPNIVGGILATGYGIALRGWKKIRPWSEWLVTLLITAGAMLSFSRNAWVVLVAIILVKLVRHIGEVYYYRRLLVGALIVIALIMGVYADTTVMRVTGAGSLERRSVSERVDTIGQWRQVWETSPWWGVGAGGYTQALAKLNPGGEVWDYQPVHNIFLLILAELGIVGLGIWLWLIAGTVWMSMKLWYWHYYSSFVMAWWGLLFIGLTDHWVWSQENGILALFIALALLFSSKKLLLDSNGGRRNTI